MKQVTRNIDPGDAQDLLEQVPRACLSFATDHGPYVQPVRLLWYAGRYLISISEDSGLMPAPDQEVVLLVDGGIYYFQLRAIYVRGQAQPAEAPNDATAGRAWFEVVPIKTVAWDYGKLREVRNEH